jgi:hypothetical protein
MTGKKGTKTTTAAPKTNTSNLNAAHRLGLIEAQLGQLIQQQQNIMNGFQKNFQILADEIDQLRELTIGVGRRVNATIQAAESGNLTSDAVNNLIIEDNIKRLKEQVAQMVQMGAISPSEVVDERSFFIGRELDDSGKVTNPRYQMSFDSASKAFQAVVIGKKVGDIVVTDITTGASFEITEVYAIAVQTQEVQEDSNEVAQVSQEA